MIQFCLNWPKKHKWTTAFIAVFTGLLIGMPFALQIGLQQLLLKQGQAHGIEKVEINDIDFNPFMGRLSLNQLTLYREQQVLSKIDQLDLQIRLRDLWKKRLMVESLTLSDTLLPLRLNADNQLEISGFPMPLTPSPESKVEANRSGLAIQFGVKSLHLHNIAIILETPDDKTEFTVKDLQISEENNYARLHLNSLLNNTPLRANLQLHLQTTSPKVVGTLSLKALNLEKFRHLLPELPEHAVLSNDITFTLEKDAKGFALYQQGNWSIEALRYPQGQQNLTLQNFGWHGDLHLFTENTSTNTAGVPKMTLNGQANLQGFNFSDGVSQTQLSHDAVADVNITALLDTENPTISQTGKLIIKQFKFDSPTLNTQNKQTTWRGKIDFGDGTTPFINAHGVLAMTDVKTSLPEQKINLQHQLQANLNLQVDLDDAAQNGLKIQQVGDLFLNDLQVTQAPVQLNLKQIHWNGDLQFAQNPAKADRAADTSITSNGKLKSLGLRALNQQNQLTLAQFDALNISKLRVNQLANISLEHIKLTHLKVAQSKDLKQPGLVSLKNLKLDHAKLQRFNQLTLGTLELQGSDTHLTLDKEGKITELAHLLDSLPGSTVVAEVATQRTDDTVKTAAGEETSTGKSDFHYQLNGLKTTDFHQIHLTNQQIDPPLVKTIQLSTLTLGKLNSQKPLEKTAFSLAFKLDEFSHLNSQGTLQPLNPKFNLEAKTKLEGFSLLELSPLIEQKLGYQIKSGQFSLDATTKIKDNVIDAENQIHLNKFVIAAADKSKTALIEKDFTMPLEAGLALLKDKKDNIDLKLPIKGNIDSPDFKLQAVISKAINSSLIKASRTYLLLALQPFGAILLAGEFAADQLSAVKLQSVNFVPGETTLSLEMLVYMAKIQKLLDERKSIQIKLCGGANELDRKALQQIAVEAAIKAEQKKAAQAAITFDNGDAITPVNKSSKITITDAQLLELAAERQAVIKRHLIKLGSQSKQLILCQPKITDSKQPTVDLGI